VKRLPVDLFSFCFSYTLRDNRAADLVIERNKQDMENRVLRLGSLSEEGRMFSKLSAQCADRLEAHKKECLICKGA
jgi:hypothetical protein